MSQNLQHTFGFCSDTHEAYQTYVFGEVAFESIRALTEQDPRVGGLWSPAKNCFYNAFISLPAAMPIANPGVGRKAHHLPWMGQQKPVGGSQHGDKPYTILNMPSSFTEYPPEDEYPPEFQGYCASCVAFALTHAAEQIAFRDGTLNAWESLNLASLFFGGGGDCWTGWTLSQALHQLEHAGIVVEPDDWPDYEGYNPGFMPDPKPRMVLKAKGYIDFDDNKDFLKIKEWLDKVGPLVGVMEVHPEFFLYGQGAYRPVSALPVALHALAIVDYDDDMDVSPDPKAGKGAWLCRNSFGENWGEDGYVWIPYDCDVWVKYRKGDTTRAPHEGLQFWGIAGLTREYAEFLPPTP